MGTREDDENKMIKGTNGNDYVIPNGHGRIKTGKGNDTVVIAEGDFFEIDGLSGTDKSFSAKKI